MLGKDPFGPYAHSALPTAAPARLRARPRGDTRDQQQWDRTAGHFVERIHTIGPFPPIAPGASAVANTQILSLGGRFVRIVAMRGVLANSTVLPLSLLEPASLFMRMVLNGADDLVVAQIGGGNFASFDAFFSHSFAQPFAPTFVGTPNLQNDPWMWFAAPPRLRAGDRLQVTIQNRATAGEGVPTLTPELALRYVDAMWWERFYLGWEEP